MGKKIVSALVVFLAVLATLQTAGAASAEYGYQIEVTNTSFLPSTIYAGDTVSLEVEIKNRASEVQLVDVEAELVLGDQFEEINATDSISYLRAGETKTLTFEFQAKAGTSSGYYSVPLTITYLSGKDLLKQTHIVFVPVSKTEKNLDITIEPNVINPGKPTQVVFTIKNVGNTPVSNISLSWAEENNLVLPIGSDNKRYVNLLPANQAAEVSYLITADPNITPGIYPLDISVTFNDIESSRTQTSHIGLIVGGTTEFEISAEMLTTGQVSISIANIGSNNAGAVVVRIPDQTGVTVSGSDASILGNLNRGDFTLANFEMRIVSNLERQPQEGSRPQASSSTRGTLLVEIDYTDTTGERQSIEKELELNTVFSDSGTGETQTGFAGRTSRQAGNQNQYIAWAVLALIVVGAAAFNRFKAGNSKWKRLGIVLAGIAALFLAVVFLLESNIWAVLVVSAVSLAALARFFREKEFNALLGKAMKLLKKKKE